MPSNKQARRPSKPSDAVSAEIGQAFNRQMGHVLRRGALIGGGVAVVGGGAAYAARRKRVSKLPSERGSAVDGSVAYGLHRHRRDQGVTKAMIDPTTGEVFAKGLNVAHDERVARATNAGMNFRRKAKPVLAATGATAGILGATRLVTGPGNNVEKRFKVALPVPGSTKIKAKTWSGPHVAHGQDATVTHHNASPRDGRLRVIHKAYDDTALHHVRGTVQAEHGMQGVGHGARVGSGPRDASTIVHRSSNRYQSEGGHGRRIK
jgi:hypothetical protein